MDEFRMRMLFAIELRALNENALAERILNYIDNSNGGTAAIAAMKRMQEEILSDLKDLIERIFIKKGN